MTRALLGVLLTSAVVVAGGLVVREVASRAAAGRLDRNALAGIRTRATQSSDEAWLAAHRAGEAMTRLGGTVSVATGALALAAAVLVAAFGGDQDLVAMVGMSILLVGVVVVLALVVIGAVAGHRAAVAVRDAPGWQ